jgi:Zn-dependent protease with chaperone function
VSFEVTALCAGLAWFLLVSTTASGAVAIVVGWAIARPAGRLARAGASAWLALRLLPTLAGLLFVAAVFSPAFGRFEPREAAEAPGIGLVSLAATSAALIGWASVTALAGLSRTAAHARGWLARSNDLSCTGAAMSVHAVRDLPPTVSLVGLWRPRLFVSSDIAAALTPDELDAVVAHERQHRCAWDNLKRLVVLAAPDVLRFLGAGAALESRWLSAAEMEADRRAVGGDPAKGVSLASALVKVARLMPVAELPAAPVCEFHNGGLLGVRIGRLIEPGCSAPRHSTLIWPGLAVAFLIACAVTTSVAQSAVQQVTEFLVNFAR